MNSKVDTLSVLLLAPEEYHSESLVEEFSRAGVETEIQHISTMGELNSSLLMGEWNLILVSPWEGIDTEGAMNLVTRTGFQTPFLVLPSEEEAGRAVARLLASLGHGAPAAAEAAPADAVPLVPPLPPPSVDLGESLDRITETLRAIAGDSVDYACLGPSELLYIHAAPGEVESAALAIVMNARQAMSSGGRLLIEARRAEAGETAAAGIHVALLAAEGCALLSISDTGGGMDPDVVTRAFEPCFSAWADGRRAGLGLAQVRALLESRGGRADLESEPGRGTIVRLYWPVTRG